MDIFKKFATDPEKELNGTVVQLDDTTSLLIRRFANPDHLALLNDLNQRHKVVLNSTDPKVVQDAKNDISREAMANHILVGWEGIEFKGKPMEYSVANAKVLLGLNDFMDFVFSASRNIENYRVDDVAKIEKNSSAG
jgi:hypothetical protein